MLPDITWVVCVKVRCYVKGVLSLNVPPKYVNLCGLSTARHTGYYILKRCLAMMEVVRNEEMEDI